MLPFHFLICSAGFGRVIFQRILISGVQMHVIPVALLIAVTFTVADILMKQFGHANRHEMISGQCVLEAARRKLHVPLFRIKGLMKSRWRYGVSQLESSWLKSFFLSRVCPTLRNVDSLQPPGVCGRPVV